MPLRTAGRRCAIYTRKSSEEGLDQAFNSLDAQREACEAYIKSQVGEGWQLIRTLYDDGGVSGGTMDRPALQRLLADIQARRVDTVVVYKVDRLTRSLADFAKIVEVFDTHDVSFVSVTQQFNTTTSMGRLTLNMLLSFAQFEREVTGERIRDKIAASKKKGMWMGGFVPLGYEAEGRTLIINDAEAETVRTVYRLYCEHRSVRRVKEEGDRLRLTTKLRRAKDGSVHGGRPLSLGYIYRLLKNPLYVGRVAHKGVTYEGQHAAIIDPETWDMVQGTLAENAHERRAGLRAAEPSLLAGLLYDDRGNRLSPSHAVKRGVRYRYYVSQAVLKRNEDDTGAIIRVPAREIEELVSARIVSFLKDPGSVMDDLGGELSPRDQQRLSAAAEIRARCLARLSSSARRAFFLRVVSAITLTRSEVRVILRRTKLRIDLLDDAAPQQEAEAEQEVGDKFTIVVPARLRLSSGEVRLVVPPRQTREMRPRPNGHLIKAVTRAHQWKQRVFAGEAPSVLAIAREDGIAPRYLTRIMRLAFLAPDIVEAILDGYQPADLELEQIIHGVPLAWDEQRRLLRFDKTAR